MIKEYLYGVFGYDHLKDAPADEVEEFVELFDERNRAQLEQDKRLNAKLEAQQKEIERLQKNR